MSIDLHHETLLTAAEARARLHVSSVTLWRWTARGCRGVRLETRRVGGQRYTSVEALERFSAALDGEQPAFVPSRSTAKRQKDQERAKERLRKAGFRV